MKTFLQICQDVWSETGISGAGPVSVTTAVGIERRLVGWVRDAWKDVQQFRPDWPWMINEVTFALSPQKDRYSLAELVLTDNVEKWLFDNTKIYKTYDGKDGEQYISGREYLAEWPAMSLGTQTPAQPESILYDPTSNDLVFYPVPDAEYSVTTRYYRQPQALAADLEVPLMPPGSKYQDIIKWKALVYYGFYDGAPDILGEAEQRYGELIIAMDNQYGQIISVGYGPLA